MATTKIVLFPKKAKKNNECPLYLRVIKNRKSKLVSLKLYILPKYWDADKEKVKPGHPNSIRFNNYLAEKTRAALDNLIDLEILDPDATLSEVKQSVMGYDPINFFTYAKKFNTQMEKSGKLGTYYRYFGIISKLEKYVGVKEFTFHHITVDFLKTYENYMRGTLENSTNTIVSNLKVIKRIFNEALKDDVINLKKNPFTNYKLSWEPTTKVFLTEKEIEILEKLVLPKYSTKFNQRNLYIFACYAGGIRISDLLQLKWEHISDDHIILNTKKTGSTISIKIPTKAMEILNLYHKEEEKKSDFIFPFLDQTDKLDDPKILISRLASITSHMNRGLKEIAKLAKIEKNIHFHTSRHTWATRALKKGMRIEYVSKLMGHSSIKTTQVYAKIVNEDLDNAMDLFEDKPIEQEEKKE